MLKKKIEELFSKLSLNNTYLLNKDFNYIKYLLKNKCILSNGCSNYCKKETLSTLYSMVMIDS